MSEQDNLVAAAQRAINFLHKLLPEKYHVTIIITEHEEPTPEPNGEFCLATTYPDREEGFCAALRLAHTTYHATRSDAIPLGENENERIH